MATLFVLAAGMGSRFGGLKQMKSVGPSGESLLEYSVYDAIQAGFTKACFLIRPEMEQSFRDQLISRFEDKIECSIAFQLVDMLPATASKQCLVGREKVWGTGHALWCARESLTENFAVINADDFYGRASYRKLFQFFTSNSNAKVHAMVGFLLGETLSTSGAVSRGICQTENSYLSRVEECLGLERRGNRIVSSEPEIEWQPTERVSMNCWGFSPQIFESLEAELSQFLNGAPNSKAEFYLPAFVQAQIDQQQVQVKVLESDSKWFGITFPQDLELVQQQVEQLCGVGEYPRSLWL